MLTLENVDITVGAGGIGASGGMGLAVSGTTTCSTFGDSKSGTPGDPGAPGANGTYTAGGFVPGATAGTGTGGGPGDCGSDFGSGTTADCTTKTLSSCCVPPECPTPVCSCGGLTQTPTTGKPGTLGSAGIGGNPGTGAGGGGASIGLYVAGGAVELMNSSITAGSGGIGGSGGGGSGGTAGTAGNEGVIPGTTSPNCNYCTLQSTTYPACTLEDCTVETLGGSAGGQGGTGGLGGAGGGGAGGDSYAYYTFSGATVTSSGTTMLAAASPAAGGSGGNMGPDGRAGPHN